ncbi:MAG: tRNA (guanosine(37)-N1)-methyltransferase TrmD, partial [bacterium]|nr:tRNA (guanosine(37)-N1)-methyltransferase TrmD [bacterium]
MTFQIITLFPEVFEAYVNSSMLWRAQKEKKVKFKFYNPRDYTKDKHRKVDDRPYGGGPGMVLSVQPLLGAVERIVKGLKSKVKNGKAKKLKTKDSKLKIIIMSPAGKQFTNT